jgi:hypothetical protein
MAVTTRIPESQLASYFEQFTKRFLLDDSPETASVEVLSPNWGEQHESEGETLLGITYDKHTNALEFELTSGDHRVYEPSEVWVMEDKDGFVSGVEIIRPDEVKEVVTIRRAGRS